MRGHDCHDHRCQTTLAACRSDERRQGLLEHALELAGVVDALPPGGGGWPDWDALPPGGGSKLTVERLESSCPMLGEMLSPTVEATTACTWSSARPDRLGTCGNIS